MNWKLPDHYRLERLLGRGGFSEVYLATDMRAKRRVAVKILPHAELEPRDIEALKTEARIVSGLAHPNIAELYGIEDIPAATALVMEFVPGLSLAQSMKDCPRLTLDEVVRLGVKIALALGYAHRHQVVHLDLKPSNILMTEEDEPKIVDFGLSRLAGGLPSDAEKILGTPHFMSPEIIRNERARPESDIYSLGIMLFLLTTGRLPFEAETRVGLFRAHLEDAPPDPRSVNPDIRPPLAAAIRRAMEKSPRRRFHDAESFARALEEAGGTRLNLVQAAEAHEPLAPGEEEMLQYTIATDVLAPGLSLPRTAVTEFMLCGSICRESRLVSMNSYSRERIRVVFAGRQPAFSRAEAVEEKERGFEVTVGRGVACKLAPPRRGTAPEDRRCAVSRLGHDAVEKRLLEADVALRVVQTEDALVAGTTFDEPPASVHLSARQMLKGKMVHEFVKLEHHYSRAPGAYRIREDAPPVGQGVMGRLLEIVRDLLVGEVMMENLSTRLGTAELMFAALADHMVKSQPGTTDEADELAHAWLDAEAEERWNRFIKSAKAGWRESPERSAQAVVAAMTRGRASLGDIREARAAGEWPKEGVGARLSGMLSGEKLHMFPFGAAYGYRELQSVRYPAGDGFPGSYLEMWMSHVLERGDFLLGRISLLERWRRFVLAAWTVGLLARGLTLLAKSLDMQRIHVVEAVRLLEFFYYFGGEIDPLLEIDPRCTRYWAALHKTQPLAPSLSEFL